MPSCSLEAAEPETRNLCGIGLKTSKECEASFETSVGSSCYGITGIKVETYVESGWNDNDRNRPRVTETGCPRLLLH
uniref:Uncharacterized protein n=1 Tax=Steinernema glaseri TaxID=37863 RepID=A0A1I7Z5Y3_9BILA